MKTHHTKTLYTVAARLFLLWAMLSASSLAFAQNNLLRDGTLRIPHSFEDETKEPAPAAWQPEQYRMPAVEGSTGALQLHVPICEVGAGDLVMPVSLSYAGSGIKADDENCLVGLGWTLQAGGYVQRIVNGRPDSTNFTAPRDAYSISDSEEDLDYLRNILQRKTDASYDRYYYSFGGYSGSFIIKGNIVTQLPKTDLDIDFYGEEQEGVRDFVITTPDGTSYYFREREHTSNHYVSETLEARPNYRSPDYCVVTGWHLSKVVSPARTDSIMLSYRHVPLSRTILDNGLRSSSWTMQNQTFSGNPPSFVSSQVDISRPDACILQSVSSRAGTLTFTSNKLNSGSRFYVITKIDQRNCENSLLRSMSFQYSESDDSRPLLTVIDFKSGGTLLDRRSFTYYASSSSTHSDLFGYKNKTPNGDNFTRSVLGPGGDLSDARTFDFSCAVGLSLESMTDANGARTTVVYEPAVCDSMMLLDSLAVTIGLRVKSITASDLVKGTEQKRSYSYSNAACTIDFRNVSWSAFIEPGGTYVPTFFDGTTYTYGAVLTSSCRIPGVPLADARVYYGRVVEKTTGTDIPDTLLTIYEYDVSNIQHPFVGNSQWREPTNWQNNVRYLGSMVYIPPFGQTEIYRKLYNNQCIEGHIRENVRERGLLTHRSVMQWNGNAYEAFEEELHYYSNDEEEPMNTGFYVTLMTRSLSSPENGSIEIIDYDDYNTDFNYMETTAQSARVFRDSTVYIRHFPNGKHRRTSVAYSYHGRMGFHAPVLLNAPDATLNSQWPTINIPLEGFSSDSVTVSDLHLLHSVKVRQGSSSLVRYYCYSTNVRTPYYNRINSLGHHTLPVMEKIVIDGEDSLLVSNVYASFGSDGNVRLASRHILHGSHEVASQRFGDYDAYGNPLSTTLNHATTTSYRWGYNSTLPVIKAVGEEVSSNLTASQLSSDASLLSTTYTHKPLVGCTLITQPDGRHTGYSYLSTRLCFVRNNSNQISDYFYYRLNAQEEGQGTYVRRITYTGDSSNSSITQKTIYNGFGQEAFSVQTGASPDGSDIVAMKEYDGIGRLKKAWLPVSMASGTTLGTNNVASSAQAFYGDNRPFAEQVFASLPDELMISSTLAGSGFATHPTTYSYLCSTTEDGLLHCRRFRLSGENAFRADGFWGDGDLDVTVTTDGDGRSTYVFTDYRGQKMLERRVLSGRGSNAETADTYYIYDALGNLRFVLPPALMGMEGMGNGPWDIDDDDDLMAYAYKYNERLDLVEKKLPGAASIRYVHDLSHQPVLMQDGNLRQRGRWRLLLSDRYGRPALDALVSGVDTSGIASRWVHATGVDYANASSTFAGSGYTANITASWTKLLKASYYDNYDMLSMSDFQRLSMVEPTGNVHGLQTATLETLSRGNEPPICTVTAYDAEGRPADVTVSNILGGKDRTQTTYTRDGRTKSVVKTHELQTGDTLHVEHINYSYDSAGRLQSETHQLDDNAAVTLVSNSYDAVGRLASSSHGGVAALTESFTYNPQGWLTSKSSSLFSEQLLYEQPLGGAAPQYGGNISSIQWTVSSDHQRSYSFAYDGLSRLASATYAEGSSANGHYDTEYGYDLMGNILSLSRGGLLDDQEFGLVDDLTFSYNGNQLVKVDDSVNGPFYNNAMHFVDGADVQTEYTYDANGNMTKDRNKGFTLITYTPDNLPDSIAADLDRSIAFCYTASGKKVRETTRSRHYVPHPLLPGNTNTPNSLKPDTTVNSPFLVFVDTRSYCDNLVYSNTLLQRMLVDGGYITSGVGGIPKYHFYQNDHLGNVRVVTDANGTVEEVNHYYPYGALMGESQNTTTQPYKYNGKELDRSFGLDWYDYGARWMDGVGGRWSSMDPLCEKYYHISPYAYCAGNPVNRVDVDGRDWYKTKSGVIVYNDNLTSKNASSLLVDGERYLGAKFNDGIFYYSLFGNKLDAKSKEGKLYEHIDNSLIQFARKAIDSENAEMENFDIGISYNKNVFGQGKNIYTNNDGFFYEGGYVQYYVYDKNSNPNCMYGNITDFPNKNMDEGRNNQVKGYPLIIKQSSSRDGSYGNSPIVRVTFKTEKLRDRFLANFSKQFMENGTYRKIY